MIQPISGVQGFTRIEGIDGIDRVRQRISEIEKKFGVGDVINEDFQTILNKELEKTQTKGKVKPVDNVEKEEIDDESEIETFNATNSEKEHKVNSTPEKKSNVQNPTTATRTFPGEEALPNSMREAINPFAAIASKPSTRGELEAIEEEEIETPTPETKRLSSVGSASTTEEMIEAAAEKYNVDSKLVKAVAIAESNMNQNDISDAGAIGVMQLMPGTAAALGVDPYDEQQNIEGGAKYLRQMLDTFGGNVRKAVAAYNAGPGAVQRYGGIPPYSETQHYVGRVMDLYR